MSTSTNTVLHSAYQPLPATHQVAVLVEPKHYRLETQVQEDCGPGQIRVRLEGCGVCASSIPVWEGRPWFEYPMEAGSPGHEGWGVAVELGSEVDNFHLGQRVACLGNNAFAETIVVDADQAVPLPDSLNAMPFPGEAIGCAMNIFRRSDIRAGHTVAIIGAGFLGLLLVQLAVSAGATVFAASRRASARQLAEGYGVVNTFDTEDWWGNAHRIVELTGNSGCDRVIEVTGMQFALDMATEMIAEYGKLIIAGFHQDGLRQVNMQTWNWRGIDVVNAHERDARRYIQGIEEAVAATVEAEINPEELLTHRFTMDQLDQAFQMMLDRPDGFVKGWIQLSR